MTKQECCALLKAATDAVKWLTADDELGRFSEQTVRAVLRTLREALPKKTTASHAEE